jgi:hypothetical protein
MLITIPAVSTKIDKLLTPEQLEIIKNKDYLIIQPKSWTFHIEQGTTASTANSVEISSSTGSITVLWWLGTLEVVNNGSAATAVILAT